MFNKIVKKVKFRVQRFLLHVSLNMLLNIFKLSNMPEIRKYYMIEFDKLVSSVFNMLQNGTVKIKQLTIKGDNQYFKGEMTVPLDYCLFISMFYYGCQENEIQHFVQSKIKKGVKYCVIDIGANVGAFTNQLHSNFNDFRYVCVEPDKKMFNYLKINTQNIKDISLFNVALSDYNGNSEYYYDDENIGNRGLNGSAIKEFCKGDVGLTDKVEVRNTNDFIRENIKILKEREIILKIDTQGSDLVILQKIFEELGQNLAIIVVELTPSCFSSQDVENVINILKCYNVYLYKHNQNYYIYDFEKVDIVQLKHDLFNSKSSFSIYVSK